MQVSLRWIAVISSVAVAAGGLWIGKHQYSARATDAPLHEAPRLSLGQAPAQATIPGTTGASPSISERPQSVEVIRPRRQNMARYLNVPGTMEAYEQADLYAKASGYISEVRADIGDRVREGDVLAVIDVPEMIMELEEAKASQAAAEAEVKTAEAKVLQAARMLDMAKASLTRYQAELSMKELVLQRRHELFKEQAITQEQLDEAQNQFDITQADVGIAEAKIAAAQADIASAEASQAASVAQVAVSRARIERIKTLMQYAKIVAPFDGVVTQRLVDRGALVQAATSNRTSPLFKVHRTDLLRITIEAPEVDIEFIRPGCAVKIRPYSMSDTELASTITRVASSLRPDTRTMRAEIDLPNGDGRLMSGMYAQVVIEIDAQANALTIPATSLLTEGNEAFVYTVVDNRAVRTPVIMGLDDGIRIQVVSGLDDSALVVDRGKGLITEGALLHPVQRDERS